MRGLCALGVEVSASGQNPLANARMAVSFSAPAFKSRTRPNVRAAATLPLA